MRDSESNEDIKRKMPENSGSVDDDQELVKILEPVICPRCKTSNPSLALYFSYCSMVLCQKQGIRIEDSVENAKGSDDYNVLLD